MTNQEAIEYLNTLYMAFAVFPNQQISLGDVDKMKESVTMAIKALEQEPSGDLISRQAVLEIQTKYAEYIGATKFWQMRDDIKALPPVTQKSKIGYWFAWKPEDDVWRTTCSECGEETRTLWNYCPHCGAKMVEPQERSGEE